MSKIFYEQTVNLRTNDFDTYDQIKTSALLELFQDIAGLHAEQIGIGYEASLKSNHIWVLVRNKLEIFENPEPLTYATLKTWPHEKGRADFNREYLLEDVNGKVLARGLSKWVIIDTNTRRLCRGDSISYGEGELWDDNYYNDVEKVVLPDTTLFKKVLSHKVTKNDLDHNKHMNNAKYTDLVFDSVDDKLFIKNLLIEYHQESKLDDIIDLYIYEDEERIYHLGMINDKKIFSSIIEKE